MEQKQTNFDTPDDFETEKRLRSRFMPDKPDIKHNENEGQIDEKLQKTHYNIGVLLTSIMHLSERLRPVIINEDVLKEEPVKETSIPHSKVSDLERTLLDINQKTIECIRQINNLTTNIRL